MSEYRLGKVTIDHVNVYDAEIRNGDTWNGAAIPRFTKEVAEKVAADTNIEAEQYPNESCRFKWRGTWLWMFEPNSGQNTVYPGTDGFYAIGAGSWIWCEVEDD